MSNNRQKETQFKKGNKPKSGRPKSMKKFINETFFKANNFKLQPSQLKEIVIALMSKSDKEMYDIQVEENIPFWIKIICKRAQEDISNGNLELLYFLFDRCIGKPTPIIQQNDDGTVQSINILLSNAKEL